MSFIPNPNFLSEIRKDDEYVDGMVDAAERIADQAVRLKKQIMPKDGRTGSRSVVVEVADGEVTVGNTDSGAHIDEYGSVNSPPYRPMTRAVEAAGFRLKESPK